MHVVRRLQSLRHREHTATVELIEALVECHHTRAYLPAGHASVWALLVDRLKYSPAAASRRTAAMKFALRSPRVLDMLRAHRTSLSALAKVVSLLEQNVDVDRLLDAIDGRSQVEVESIAASLRPCTKPAEKVRRVAVVPDRVASARVATALPLMADAHGSGSAERTTTTRAASPTTESTPESKTPGSAAEPTSAPTPAPRVALSFSVREEDYAAFERARAILSRKLPAGVTLEDALNELVAFFLARKGPGRTVPERKPRRKSAIESVGQFVGQSAGKSGAESESEPKQEMEAISPSEPLPQMRPESDTEPEQAPAPRSRHIPRSTRDLVFRRDGERCTFVATDGTRCESTHDLEIDHVVPYALGGSHEPGNLRVLCAKHNRWRAERTFGTWVPRRNSAEDRTLDSC